MDESFGSLGSKVRYARINAKTTSSTTCRATILCSLLQSFPAIISIVSIVSIVITRIIRIRIFGVLGNLRVAFVGVVNAYKFGVSIASSSNCETGLRGQRTLLLPQHIS